MQTKILVVEDDNFLRDGLYEMLTKEGYSVAVAENCAKSEEVFENQVFDLILLDVMLPDGDGFSLCKKIRETNTDIPILFLTACDDEYQVVRGLDAGADDYVTKPFKLLELLSRIRAVLRRSKKTVFATDDLIVDTANMTVKQNGEILLLTPTEFHILSTLMKNEGVIVTRAMLLEKIWDCDGAFVDDNTLSVHISRLREKIGVKHISTIRGIGYRWEN